MSTIKKSDNDDEKSDRKAITPDLEQLEKDREVDLAGDIVNEESDDSFPCSDPPGWISERPKHNRGK